MSICRILHSCRVFEGKIVVTGGCFHDNLKSVESDDHHEDTWSDLADMIEERYCHGTVSMGNKIFVIGGFKHLTWNLTCEVLDSSSRKFSSLKQMLVVKNLNYYRASVVSISNNIFAFSVFRENSKFQIYDFLTNLWCSKENDFIEAKWDICCSKLPLV